MISKKSSTYYKDNLRISMIGIWQICFWHLSMISVNTRNVRTILFPIKGNQNKLFFFVNLVFCQKFTRNAKIIWTCCFSTFVIFNTQPLWILSTVKKVIILNLVFSQVPYILSYLAFKDPIRTSMYLICSTLFCCSGLKMLTLEVLTTVVCILVRTQSFPRF